MAEIFWFFAWLFTATAWIIKSRIIFTFFASLRRRRQEAEFIEKMSDLDIEIKHLLEAADVVERQRSMNNHPTSMGKPVIPDLDLTSIMEAAIEETKKKPLRPYRNIYLKYWWDNQGGGYYRRK